MIRNDYICAIAQKNNYCYFMVDKHRNICYTMIEQ